MNILLLWIGCKRSLCLARVVIAIGEPIIFSLERLGCGCSWNAELSLTTTCLHCEMQFRGSLDIHTFMPKAQNQRDNENPTRAGAVPR